MADIEKRFVRIEDWKGNIYYPETSSVTSVAGYTIDASDASTDSESSVYTEGSIISDSSANKNKAIILNESEADKVLIRADFDGIQFGKVAISMRVKSSIKTTASKLFKIQCYHVDYSTETPSYTLLATKEVTGASISTAGAYEDLSFVFDNAGYYSDNYKLQVKVTRYGTTSEEGTKSSFTLHLDNISATKAFPGFTAI